MASGGETMASTLEQDSHLMDLMSRQIEVYGLEAIGKLREQQILCVGLRGIGMEVCKNLALAGPGGLTLYDDNAVAIGDLGGNFFLKEDDVGRARSEAVCPRLQELNGLVAMRVHTGALTEEVVASHTVVLFTNTTMAEMQRWNSFCRAQSPAIGFVACDSFGAAGYVFTDYGPEFTVRDRSGENPANRIITGITNEEEGVVTLLGAHGEETGRMHGMEESEHDGWVEITDVEGMDGINETRHRIKFAQKTVKRKKKDKEGKEVEEDAQVFDPFRLKIGDTRGFPPYVNGGVMTQVKVPVAQRFRSLADNLAQPVSPGEFGLLFTDGAKWARGEQLHMGFRALWDFQAAHDGALPAPHSEGDTAEVVAAARRLNDEARSENKASDEPSHLALEELDEAVLESLARYAAVELQPLATFFGGVVAQEIVKFTGKFTPLNQWLHFDCFEVLPDTPPEDVAPRNSRYDHVVAMFGGATQQKIADTKTFMVGCGALGCEFLKNFAMLGVATGEQGLVTVTDNDRIEVSNLNRQFLFRADNVGQPKSEAASSRVVSMNPAIKVNALQAFVAPQTESQFDDRFWEGQTLVTNALDNVKARKYVDSRCVFYGKPLLESGTLGTKCNVQVVVPHITQSYTDGPEDAEEDAIPMCTLRNFPSLIEHCIEWGRGRFEDFFVVPYQEAKKLVDDREAVLSDYRAKALGPKGNASEVAKALDELKAAKETLERANGITFEACVGLAWKYFDDWYRAAILQLVHEFPEDHETSEGERFWSGAKRFPQNADFDKADANHFMFITAVANILAVNFGLQPNPEQQLLPPDHAWRQPATVAGITDGLDVPMWEPKSGRTVQLEEDKEGEEKKATEDAAAAAAAAEDPAEQRVELEALLEELAAWNLDGLNLQPADFEKDQDLNFHIDFIASASNIRAANYRITQTSRHKCKVIAGKIIPAIATTTASVTGLVMIEYLKLMQDKPLEAYKDSSNNLGLNMFMMQEPMPPEKAKDEYDPIEMAEVKCQPPEFTKWDKTVINQGALTMRQFLAAFTAETGLNITLLFHAIAELEGTEVRGRMLYERDCYIPKNAQLYEAKMDAPLAEWVAERYAGVDIMLPGRKYVELQASCCNDADEPFKVPTIVFRFAE